MSGMQTVESVPRDINTILGLSRAIRYRLVLNLGIFQNGSPEEGSFIGADNQTQSQMLLDALLARDSGQQIQPMPQMQNMQQVPQISAPVQMQPQSVQPTVYAPPPMQVQMNPIPITPRPMGMAAVTPMQTAPIPQQNYVPVQQYRAPVIPITGAVQAPPQPAPMPSQGYTAPNLGQPTVRQPVRQPNTLGDPANMGAGTSPSPIPGSDLARIMNICAKASDLNNLREIVLGMARTQNMLGLIILEIAVQILGVDKDTIIRMAVSASSQGEPETLFARALQSMSGKG